MADVVFLFRQSVDNGVFHNRLEDQTGHLVVHTGFVYAVIHLKTIGIAYFHQINIAVQHIQLLPDRIEADASPKGAGQDFNEGFRHFADAVKP